MKLTRILGPILIVAAAGTGLALGLRDAPQSFGAATIESPPNVQVVELPAHAASPRRSASSPASSDEVATAGAPAVRLEERPPEDLVAQALGAATAADRAAALAALAYALSGTSGSVDYVGSVLLQSLADADEQVRSQALATIKDTAQDFPEQAVASIARDDPSPAVRVQALELLLERSETRAHGALRMALADPEPQVRDRAQELLDDAHIEITGD